jgi:hypothetical protein
MLYVHALTIPANTAVGDPVTYDLKLTHGILHRVEVEFPPLCAGLAHLVVERFGSQLWPTNPDGDLASDGYTIAWDEDYELTEAPYSIKLRGWNEDDTYPHTITLRVALASVSPMDALTEMRYILRRLASLVGIK